MPPDTPEREGYEFLGWFVDGGSTQWTPGTLTGDLNLVAKWEQIEYKVQFDPNGGTWDDGTGAAKVEYTTDGSIASIKPADPVRPVIRLPAGGTMANHGTSKLTLSAEISPLPLDGLRIHIP